jgi:hypothetical protein
LTVAEALLQYQRIKGGDIKRIEDPSWLLDLAAHQSGGLRGEIKDIVDTKRLFCFALSRKKPLASA